jgi:hypothetical protein
VRLLEHERCDWHRGWLNGCVTCNGQCHPTRASHPCICVCTALCSGMPHGTKLYCCPPAAAIEAHNQSCLVPLQWHPQVLLPRLPAPAGAGVCGAERGVAAVPAVLRDTCGAQGVGDADNIPAGQVGCWASRAAASGRSLYPVKVRSHLFSFAVSGTVLVSLRRFTPSFIPPSSLFVPVTVCAAYPFANCFHKWLLSLPWCP